MTEGRAGSAPSDQDGTAPETPAARRSIPPHEAIRYVVRCERGLCQWRAETDFVSRHKALDAYAEHEEETHHVTD